MMLIGVFHSIDRILSMSIRDYLEEGLHFGLRVKFDSSERGLATIFSSIQEYLE